MTTVANYDIKMKALQKVQNSLRNPDVKELQPTNDKKMIILFVVPDTLEKNFGMQKIKGAKKEVGCWYKKMSLVHSWITRRRTVHILWKNGSIK